MQRSELLESGVTPGTIRLSIGIEDAHDLIYDIDIDQGLGKGRQLLEKNSNYKRGYCKIDV